MEELPKLFERQREEKASTSAVSAQVFPLISESTSLFLFTNTDMFAYASATLPSALCS